MMKMTKLNPDETMQVYVESGGASRRRILFEVNGGRGAGPGAGRPFGGAVGIADGVLATLGLYFIDDTNTGVFRVGADIMGFVTAGVEAFRVGAAQDILVADAAGIVVGGLTQIAVSAGDGATSNTPEFQVQGTGLPDSSAVLFRTGANTGGPFLVLAKGRNATIGSFTIVVDGDTLGTIAFNGDDGVDYLATGAIIRATVDGVPGVGDMPALLEFMTSADAAESPTSRMLIRADGSISVANTAPKVTLGTVSAFATTQPTNTLVLRAGTAPAGSITTAGGLFSSTTVIRKIIADGTVSNVDL